MKKNYLTPAIRIQAIDSDEFMDNSVQGIGIPILDNNNPDTPDGVVITTGTEVLGNGTSIWDEEE